MFQTKDMGGSMDKKKKRPISANYETITSDKRRTQTESEGTGKAILSKQKQKNQKQKAGVKILI